MDRLFGLLLGLCGLALAAWLPNRILHMTATAGIGGGPTYVTALARHQLEAGKQVRIFCSDEKPFVEIWRKMGMDVSVLPMRRPSFCSVWQLMKELLRAPAPIHAHGRGAAFFAVWVKMLVRIPVIYTPHGPHYAYKRGWRSIPCMGLRILFRLFFDAVLYVSPRGTGNGKNHHLPVQTIASRDVGIDERRNVVSPATTSTRERCFASGIFHGAFRDRMDRPVRLCQGLGPAVGFYPAGLGSVAAVVWVVIGDGDRQETACLAARVADRGQAGKVVFLGARTGRMSADSGV